MGVLQAVWLFVRGFSVGRAGLMAENLALRQQMAVLQRSVKRPELRTRDRVFWVWLARLWSGWQSALALARRQGGRPLDGGAGAFDEGLLALC